MTAPFWLIVTLHLVAIVAAVSCFMAATKIRRLQRRVDAQKKLIGDLKAALSDVRDQRDQFGKLWQRAIGRRCDDAAADDHWPEIIEDR